LIQNDPASDAIYGLQKARTPFCCIVATAQKSTRLSVATASKSLRLPQIEIPLSGNAKFFREVDTSGGAAVYWRARVNTFVALKLQQGLEYLRIASFLEQRPGQRKQGSFGPRRFRKSRGTSKTTRCL